MKERKSWQVYLLKCADNTIYCGVTKNLKNRLAQHRAGIGSKYTRSRLPVEPVGASGNLTKSEAYRLEYKIKKLPAGKKSEALKSEKA